MTRREATWRNMGTNVSGMNTIEAVLEASKLNYNVTKEGIYLPNGHVIPGKKATTKEGTSEVFGIVSDSYGVCQNSDAFDFVNYINEDMKFVRAGETAGGLVYVIAELPEQYILDDGFKPYVIFQNGHNGQIPVRAAIVPLRIICQNQFNTAFKKADNTIHIRHSSNIVNRMEQAKEVLKQTADYMDTFRREAEEMATMNIKGLETKIIQEFYVIDDSKSQSAQERVIEKQLELMGAYRDADDNQNLRGTVWGMVNAYTDTITHQEPTRQSDTWEESRFTKVTFDTKVLQKFINHVKSYV